jgi:MFS family permease
MWRSNSEETSQCFSFTSCRRQLCQCLSNLNLPIPLRICLQTIGIHIEPPSLKGLAARESLEAMQWHPANRERMQVNSENLKTASVMIASMAYLVENSSFPVFAAFHPGEFDVRLISHFNCALVLGVIFGSFLRFRLAFESVFVSGLLIFLIGAASFHLNENGEFLLYSRICQGLGAGMYSPLIPVLLCKHDSNERFKLLPLWATISGFTGVISPFVTSLCQSRYSIEVFWPAIMGLCVVSLALFPRNFHHTPVHSEKASPRGIRNLANGMTFFSIMTFIFLLYGSISWVTYFVPHAAAASAQIGSSGVFIGSLPWILFTIGCIGVGQLKSVNMNTFLISSLTITVASLLLLVGAGPTSPVRLALAASAAGLGMALANVPSTAVAFSITRREYHGFVSGIDIISARAGSAVFLTVFAFDSNILFAAVGVLWAGLACLALLPKVTSSGAA